MASKTSTMRKRKNSENINFEGSNEKKSKIVDKEIKIAGKEEDKEEIPNFRTIVQFSVQDLRKNIRGPDSTKCK